MLAIQRRASSRAFLRYVLLLYPLLLGVCGGGDDLFRWLLFVGVVVVDHSIVTFLCASWYEYDTYYIPGMIPVHGKKGWGLLDGRTRRVSYPGHDSTTPLADTTC